jgi:hypothetical protein
MQPAITDRTKVAGIFPMTRTWYDAGNGYGVSAIYSDTCLPRYSVAAGLWMDRRPGRLQRLLRVTSVLHATDERVHVGSEAAVLALVEHVAALPPLGSTEPPRRLLPDCECWYCTRGCAS